MCVRPLRGFREALGEERALLEPIQRLKSAAATRHGDSMIPEGHPRVVVGWTEWLCAVRHALRHTLGKT